MSSRLAGKDTRSRTSSQLEDDVTEGKSQDHGPFLHSLDPRMSPLLGNHQLDLVFIENFGGVALGVSGLRRRKVGSLVVCRHPANVGLEEWLRARVRTGGQGRGSEGKQRKQEVVNRI